MNKTFSVVAVTLVAVGAVAAGFMLYKGRSLNPYVGGQVGSGAPATRPLPLSALVPPPPPPQGYQNPNQPQGRDPWANVAIAGLGLIGTIYGNSDGDSSYDGI